MRDRHLRDERFGVVVDLTWTDGLQPRESSSRWGSNVRVIEAARKNRGLVVTALYAPSMDGRDSGTLDLLEQRIRESFGSLVGGAPEEATGTYLSHPARVLTWKSLTLVQRVHVFQRGSSYYSVVASAPRGNDAVLERLERSVSLLDD